MPLGSVFFSTGAMTGAATAGPPIGGGAPPPTIVGGVVSPFATAGGGGGVSPGSVFSSPALVGVGAGGGTPPPVHWPRSDGIGWTTLLRIPPPCMELLYTPFPLERASNLDDRELGLYNADKDRGCGGDGNDRRAIGKTYFTFASQDDNVLLWSLAHRCPHVTELFLSGIIHPRVMEVLGRFTKLESLEFNGVKCEGRLDPLCAPFAVAAAHWSCLQTVDFGRYVSAAVEDVIEGATCTKRENIRIINLT